MALLVLAVADGTTSVNHPRSVLTPGMCCAVSRST